MDKGAQAATPAGPGPLGAGGLRWLALVLLATAGVFARALEGELVYDDLALIERNPTITDLAHIPGHFTRPYWDFLQTAQADQVGYWRPLTAVVQTVTWVASGGAPWAFHAASLLFHLTATAAVFLLARRLVGDTALSACAALLFALHPVHVESVAWISAMNDPLFATLGISALVLFLRWRERGSRGIPLGAALAFALALLAKEMALCVPLMVPLVDLVRAPRRAAGAGGRPITDWAAGFRDWPRAYGPFLAVVLLYLGARMAVFESVAAGLDRIPSHFGVDATRLALLRAELWGGFVGLLVWPVELNVFRPFRPSLPVLAPEVLWAAAGLALAVGLGLVFRTRGARRELAALLIVPAALAPALVAVHSLGNFPLSDRFLYLAVLGYVALLARGVGRLLPRGVALALLLVVAGLYGARSWERVGIWRDETALFTNAVRESPRLAYVRWGLGRVLLGRFSESQDPRTLQAAKQAFVAAQDLLVAARDPASNLYVTSHDHLQANLGYGLCLLFEDTAGQRGSAATAVTIFERLAAEVGALYRKRQEAEERGLRAVGPNLSLERVYTALASAHIQGGDLEKAEEALRQALVLNPNHMEAYRSLADIAQKRGEWKLAVRHLRKALEYAPRNYDTKLSLAQSMREAGQRDRAAALAEELLEQDPSKPHPLWILAANLLEEGKPEEALVYLRRARKLDEFLPLTWYLTASAMATLDVNPEATVQAFTKATALDPTGFAAHYAFAQYLLAKGQVERAQPYVVKAYGLTNDQRHLAQLRSVLTRLELSSPDLAYELARSDRRRGELDLTEYWLDRALALDPEHPDSLFEKGRFLRQRERHGEALDAMLRACRAAPDDIPKHVELGGYLLDEGRPDEARELLEHCLAIPRPETWSEEAYASNRRLVEGLLERARAARGS